MPALRSMARDLRALGSSSPLRALYEVSKRSGFHSVLFRPTSKALEHRSKRLDFGSVVPTGDVARARCLADAEAGLKDGLRIFGKRYATGIRGSWSLDPLTNECWPTNAKWWEIDIRTDRRMSDVKFVWEGARHRDLVVLARASRLDPGGPWLAELEGLLSRWCAECLPEVGINWYSSLELALRAIAWSQILALCGDRLSGRLRSEMERQLIASARHIMLELPYTVSSMKNNHLLGDGLGLIVLGKLFPSHPAAARWQRLGDALFHKQLARHVLPDGSMIEDSLSYHRFVLEMLIVRVLIGGASSACRTAMLGASRHLVALGVLEGDVPQYGDWDEGRVLADSAPAGSVTGSAILGLVLAGERAPTSSWECHDELAWYVEPIEQRVGIVTPSRSLTTSGGFQRVAHGEWRVWFKFAGESSHQHADISSVFVSRSDNWLIKDAGTGTYNGSLEVRNGFRATHAHPVWHPTGEDLLVPHRAFRWLGTVNGYAADPASISEHRVLFGWHDAFESRAEPTRVARAIVICDCSVIVIDAVESPGNAEWNMSVPLGHGVGDELLFGLEDARTSVGERNPFAGWNSDTYGALVPARWLHLSATADHLPIWGCGHAPVVVQTVDAISVNGISYSIRWEKDFVELDAVTDEEQIQLRATRV